MRSNAWPERAFAVIVACSLEAAWITLLYVTIESLATRNPAPLPILAFAVAALIGLGLARWGAGHPRAAAYRTTLAVVVVAMGVIGWLLPLGATAAGVIEDPMVIIAMHPGGILVGLAVLRGTAHVTQDDDERIADIALGPGLAVIAAIWVLLTATGATDGSGIVDVAFSATVTFVTAALLCIGLARLADLRSTEAMDAGRRTWTGLLVAVVAVLLAVSVPLALILGVPLDHAVRGALGPLGDVVVAVLTLFLWPAGLLAAALVVVFESLRGSPTGINTPDGVAPPTDVDWTTLFGPKGPEGLALGLVPLIIGVIVVFLVVRGLVQRSRPLDVASDLHEKHEIERPSGSLRVSLPHLALPRRHPVPRTASEAYLASLEVLKHRPDVARLGPETPAEHARRLRADPIGLPLGRLAADYALAEFGRRSLRPSEHRRAIERWRLIRSRGSDRRAGSRLPPDPDS